MNEAKIVVGLWLNTSTFACFLQTSRPAFLIATSTKKVKNSLSISVKDSAGRLQLLVVRGLITSQFVSPFNFNILEEISLQGALLEVSKLRNNLKYILCRKCCTAELRSPIMFGEKLCAQKTSQHESIKFRLNAEFPKFPALAYSYLIKPKRSFHSDFAFNS